MVDVYVPPAREFAEKFSANVPKAKFEITDVQKEIIKNGHGQYAGTLQQFAQMGQYRPQMFNVTDPRGLMKTEKTARKCRLCRGNRWHFAIWQGHGGLVTKQKCKHCAGTGEVFG